jgi:hypothetical protein
MIVVPVSLGMLVPAFMAGAGQVWCLVAPGDSRVMPGQLQPGL